MKTIDNKVYRYEFTVKKSRFISFIGKVTNKQELKDFLNKYSDNQATHNCYAYKIGVDQVSGGYEDNGEPSGTAGMPIFNVIEKNNLTNVVILVIRYFGGIKLGAGPLTRTYGKAASNVIKEANTSDIAKIQEITISFPISKMKKVNKIMAKNNWTLIYSIFEENVSFVFRTKKGEKVSFHDESIQLVNIREMWE